LSVKKLVFDQIEAFDAAFSFWGTPLRRFTVRDHESRTQAGTTDTKRAVQQRRFDTALRWRECATAKRPLNGYPSRREPGQTGRAGPRRSDNHLSP
jgi:hypothetical protein